MGLTGQPRIRLATLPTPLHLASRLTETLGGPRVYMKRDDLTGLAFGGNKTRKLEYLVADAQRQGATHLITAGGIQSNHVRQTAAAAQLVGMNTALVLTSADPEPPIQGNYMVDKLFGAACHIVPPDVDVDGKMDEVAADLRDTGAVPYVIPIGGSNAVGALGYVSAMLELNHQLWEQDIAATALYHAAGSGGTQSGINVGAALYGAEYKPIGVAVSGNAQDKIDRVEHLNRMIADLLGIDNPVRKESIVCDDSQVGGGYGMMTSECLEAIQLLARTEGILLDPVYTGKVFAGMLADIRAGKYSQDESIVFLHTGGTPALFAKKEDLEPILDA